MKKRSEGCETDMTPMIDVVFQLIIFFIVTLKMDEAKNEDIQLEMGPHGPPIKEQHHTTIIVEVDRRGWISMHGAKMSKSHFRKFMINRFKKHGEFPVIIRADKRTRHKDIKDVMDLCTEAGLWRLNFMAIKEKKA